MCFNCVLIKVSNSVLEAFVTLFVACKVRYLIPLSLVPSSLSAHRKIILGEPLGAVTWGHVPVLSISAAAEYHNAVLLLIASALQDCHQITPKTPKPFLPRTPVFVQYYCSAFLQRRKLPKLSVLGARSTF